MAAEFENKKKTEYQHFWNRHQDLQGEYDCNIQFIDQLCILIFEIIHCEKTYENSLRRIGQSKIISTLQQQSQFMKPTSQILNMMIESLKSQCLNKADSLR